MATITPTLALRNGYLTNILTALNAGSGPATCKLYTGTKPATPETAVTSQVLLGTMTCSDPAGTVASGTLTFDPITPDSAADAGGTATWARFADSAGNAVMDVDASTIGGAGFLQMNTTNIIEGGPLTITACSISA